MRNLFEHIKRFRDSIARRRDPFRGRLEATADEIRLTDATGVTWSIPWTNIRKIAAFKRDLFTTDVICWELELKEPFRRGWEEFRAGAGFGRRLEYPVVGVA